MTILLIPLNLVLFSSKNRGLKKCLSSPVMRKLLNKLILSNGGSTVG
jgi:hypothetical protein